MMEGPRVVVCEPNPGGHRLGYVRRLVDELVNLGCCVELVLSHVAWQSDEFKIHLTGVPESVRIVDQLRFERGAWRRNSVWLARDIMRLARLPETDHIFVPYADGALQAAALVRHAYRPRPDGPVLEGLLMRGSPAYSRAGLRTLIRGRAWLKLAEWAPFGVIHHLDPYVVRWVEEMSPRLGRRMRLVPEPVDPFASPSAQEARRLLGLPEEGRLVGTVGWLDERKGIDLLIDAFGAARLRPTDRLLLAGRLSAGMRAWVAGLDGTPVRDRVLVLDRLLTETELRLAIVAMDVVAAPYPRGRGHTGSSSVMIHAAHDSRFCVGDQTGWIGTTIRRFGLGTTCDVNDREAFAATLGIALDAAPRFALGEAGRRFVAFHTLDNFLAHLTDRLRERIGLGPRPGKRSWSWVLEAAG